MELFPLTTMVSKFTKRFIHQHTTPPQKQNWLLIVLLPVELHLLFSTKSSCVKAKGTVERFARDKKTDPENRKSVVGYTLDVLQSRPRFGSNH
jgi:hypothetical protein